MNVQKFIIEGGKIELEVRKAEEALQAFPRGEMGLVKDFTPEYRAAKAKFDKAFKKLQDFNRSVPNAVKRERRKIQKGY